VDKNKEEKILLLSPEVITKQLQTHPGWSWTGDRLIRSYSFDRYLDGLRFVQAIAHIAEEENHHPDLTLRYGEVIVSTTTHDANGVTEKDFQLIRRISEWENA
jgi:4a-hydroxytetrahydrobiopterin dehydratase